MGNEYEIPSTAELDRMYESLKSWGRWGDDDQRGALNHLTPQRRVAAAALASSGDHRQPRARSRDRSDAGEPAPGTAPHARIG